MNEYPFLKFNTDALSFLERAKLNLSKFDNEKDLGCLRSAALDLRLGIESRLYEIIDSVSKESKQTPEIHEKESAASKLLRELLSLSPETGESCQLSISFQSPGGPDLSRPVHAQGPRQIGLQVLHMLDSGRKERGTECRCRKSPDSSE